MEEKIFSDLKAAGYPEPYIISEEYIAQCVVELGQANDDLRSEMNQLRIKEHNHNALSDVPGGQENENEGRGSDRRERRETGQEGENGGRGRE